MWLDKVKDAMGGEAPLEVTWRPFSLAQVNQKSGDPDYRAWNEPDENLDQSLWGLRAGQAARRQGEDALRAFLPLLLNARHQDRADLNDAALLQRLAGEAGLDMERFTADLNDRSTLDEIAASHTHAVEELGVFGTPTFVFEGGGSAFLKLIRPQENEQALSAFNSLLGLMRDEVFVGEVKRPQPPWPKGVFD